MNLYNDDFHKQSWYLVALKAKYPGVVKEPFSLFDLNFIDYKDIEEYGVYPS